MLTELAALGSEGLRLELAPGCRLSAKMPPALAVDATRSFIATNRESILARVIDLDRRLALAMRILDGVERKAAHCPSTLAIVATYRETLVELRERLDPMAGEADEAARLFAARTVFAGAKTAS